MTTLTDQEQNTTRATDVHEGRTGTPDRRNRTLKAIVIALVAALVGLGAWVIVDQTSTPETAPSDDVAQVWEDYTDAWNDYDGDAFLQLVTPGYTFVMDGSETNAEDMAAEVDRLRNVDWHVTLIGEPVVAGDGPWILSQVNELDEFDPMDGISVVTIVDDGGVLRIAEHIFFGER
jgi:hypothetical protein